MLNLWLDKFESQLLRLQVLLYFSFDNLASNLLWALLVWSFELFKLLLLLSRHLMPLADPLLSIFLCEVDLLELFLDLWDRYVLFLDLLETISLKIGSLLFSTHKLCSGDISIPSKLLSLVSSYISDPNIFMFIIFCCDYATSVDNLLNVMELFLEWMVSVVTHPFFFEYSLYKNYLRIISAFWICFFCR